jgi:NAD+ diphosphatase
MGEMPYAGLRLDRAGNRRHDPGWVADVLARPGSRLLPLWQDQCLVRTTADRPRPVTLPAGCWPDLSDDLAADLVFLGLDADAGVFAADLSTLARDEALRRAAADTTIDVRRLFTALPRADSATLAYARGLLHWHRTHRFCGTCGTRNQPRHGGHARVCPGCERWQFPRLEPAVIVLVTLPGTPERCLLARHAGADEIAWSTLAGFVEVGETLEGAVRRELAEEAGVSLQGVRYVGSQPWPFPAGLMIGFRAVAASAEVTVDERELADARWFTRDELRELQAAWQQQRPESGHDSIESVLVGGWLAEGTAQQ